MCRLAAAGEHIDQARSERLRIRGCAFQLGAQQRIAAGETASAESARILTQRRVDQDHLHLCGTRGACQCGRRMLVGILDLHCQKARFVRRGEALK